MNIDRHVFRDLLKWKNSSDRKPLILRGARQVGKTTLIHQFAKSYKNSVLLNLEKVEDRRFFTEFENVHTIVEALFISHNIIASEKGDTIVFIDEIQETPEAISRPKGVILSASGRSPALLRYSYAKARWDCIIFLIRGKGDGRDFYVFDFGMQTNENS